MQGVAGAGRNIFSRHLDMKFDLPDNAYKPIENIGTGAYGVVCSAIHKRSGDKVAIKKIPNAFQELTTAKRTYRELKILRHFDHDSIIRIREILSPREGVSDLKDVYVVMDLMESDLHQIIHSTQPFSLEHTRYFLYQILKGLKYIHSANVVHRDLKPSNLLVNENCELKIGDFGMARGISLNMENSKRKVFMTAYVATRWYRAPELLFSNEDYSYAVDMWSVGCIFAEMIGRKQIFPGKNPMHQLTLIVEALGMPPDKMLKSTNSDQIYNFFHKNFSSRKPVDFRIKYPGANKKAIDLLTKMLVFNPAERISVTDALKHPFLSKYHDPDDEPDCLPAFDFSFEHEDLKKEQIRQRVGKMILKYQKNVFGPTKFSLPMKSDANSGALQPTKANQLTSSKPVTSQSSASSQMASKENYSGTLFKVPIAPLSQSGTMTGSLKPLVPKEPAGSITRSLCVTTEQGATSSITDVDMKSASSEDHSGLLNFLAASLRPAASSIPISTEISDMDMNSAKSSPAHQKQAITAVKNTTKKDVLTVSPKAKSTSSDVEMKSAKGTPPVSSVQPGSNHLCADINVQMKPPGDDVTMQSARSPMVKEENTTKEKVKMEDEKKKTAMVSLLKGAVITADALITESQASKTISDDTKALIKAALMNSVKNKLRKDSTSILCSKGGGKVMVTAQSRQREREEKRRQKLKRSQERQKKQKSKSHNQENSAVLLTDEDKNLLARWSKMQSGPSGSQGSQKKHRLKSESDQSVPLQVTGQNLVVCEDGSNHGNKPLSNAGSVQMFSNANKLPTSQSAVGSVKTVTQVSMAMTSNVNRPGMTNQRRIMPKDTTNLFAGASVRVASSGVATLPNTLAIMTQVPIRQTMISNPATSQGSIVYAGDGASGGIALPSNQPQTHYVIPQQSVSSIATHDSLSSSVGPQYVMSSTANLPNSTTTVGPQPTVASVVPPQPVALSGMPNSTTTLPNNQQRQPSSTSNFQPINSVTPEKSSAISDGSSYRTRIYSDRETPSPPRPLSPPTYEQAMKAIHNSQSDPDKLDSLGSLDEISPFKPSPQTSGLPFGKLSEPDINSVIQQFSKQAVEDILPPMVLTPRGDGAGYGLSLDFEELLGGMGMASGGQQPQPQVQPIEKPLDSAPLSPSLLSDWFELSNLNVDDMQAVQQELGLTSPFNMADLASLGNISPPTKS